jgi:hypothetical protein
LSAAALIAPYLAPGGYVVTMQNALVEEPTLAGRYRPDIADVRVAL